MQIRGWLSVTYGSSWTAPTSGGTAGLNLSYQNAEGTTLTTDRHLIIRAERPADAERLFRLHFAAFGNREDEATLVERVRASDGYIPGLSLVAEADRGTVVGHALFSKAAVVREGRQREVIVLAPIAVQPEHQRRGVGGALIREGLRLAEQAGYPHVLLIGHPSYYPKFGFAPARPVGFELTQFQVPDEVFMVRTLRPDAGIRGELRYPSAFFA